MMTFIIVMVMFGMALWLLSYLAIWVEFVLWHWFLKEWFLDNPEDEDSSRHDDTDCKCF